MSNGACRVVDLNEGVAQHIFTFDIKGLVKLMPRKDPRDKAGELYVNGYAIDYYSTLLHER